MCNPYNMLYLEYHDARRQLAQLFHSGPDELYSERMSNDVSTASHRKENRPELNTPLGTFASENLLTCARCAGQA
jgi:hypothetical protein